MIIGVPKEIKNNEFRVSITPKGVKELIRNNHSVIIENNAGLNSSFNNENYVEAGAKIIKDRYSDLLIHQFAPIDIPIIINKFLNYWNPKISIFSESELLLSLLSRG